MAETVYLSDGTMEVILTDKDVFLERLLDEKLGRDAANCFKSCVQELKEELSYAQEYEKVADGYLQMCNTARDTFQQLDNLLKQPRLNRAAIQKLVTEGFKELNNNL